MQQVALHEYEINALLSWHRDQEFEAAKKEDYDGAKEHQERIKQLRGELARPLHING